jgi:hypothetical protein
VPCSSIISKLSVHRELHLHSCNLLLEIQSCSNVDLTVLRISLVNALIYSFSICEFLLVSLDLGPKNELMNERSKSPLEEKVFAVIPLVPLLPFLCEQ